MVGIYTNAPQEGPDPRAEREAEREQARERARRAAQELVLEEVRGPGGAEDDPGGGEAAASGMDEGQDRAAAREEARARALGGGPPGPPAEARGEGAENAEAAAEQGRSPAGGTPALRPKPVPSEEAPDNSPDVTPGEPPSGSLADALARISASDDEAGLRAVVAAARARLKKIGRATVEETRPFRSGLLVLEWRSHGGSPGGPRRGPYWYYRYREDGRGRSIYLGKTDDPEAAAAERLDRGPALPGDPIT